MPSFEADFRAWLLAQPGVSDLVGERVHFGRVDQGMPMPYIWFSGSFSNRERALDDEPGKHPEEITVDVEAISTDAQEALAVANAIRMRDSYRGPLGGGTCQAVFVEDQSDDYIPRGMPIGADDGLFVGLARCDVRMYVPGEE